MVHITVFKNHWHKAPDLIVHILFLLSVFCKYLLPFYGEQNHTLKIFGNCTYINLFQRHLEGKGTSARDENLPANATDTLPLKCVLKIRRSSNLPHIFLLSSIYIRRKYWIRENFRLPVFDGFTCFEISWARFDHF